MFPPLFELSYNLSTDAPATDLSPASDLRLAEVFEIDAIALMVGKLGAVFPVSRKVDVDFDALSCVADEDEWRPAVGRRGVRVLERDLALEDVVVAHRIVDVRARLGKSMGAETG